MIDRAMIFVAIALAACARDPIDLRLTFDGSPKSAILAVESSTALAVHAVELEPRARLALFEAYAGGEVTLSALAYDETLEELDLLPGTLDSSPVDPQRGLPPFAHAKEASLSEGVTTWTSRTVLSRALYDFRTPWNAMQCLYDGGCFVEGELRPRCVTPCPEPPSPEPPAPPAPPQPATCPTGWYAAMIDELAICEPFPGGGRADCPLDAAHFLGEPGCRRIGTPCPMGQYPENLPAGREIIYVAPGDSIAVALAIAPSGAIIALAKGVFEEELDLPEGITLWGACTAETVLRGLGQVGVSIRDRGAAIRNLRIDGFYHGIRADGPRASAVVEEVIIEHASGEQVLIELDAALTLRRVAVRDGAGVGVTAFSGASMTLEQVLIDNNAIVGLGGSEARVDLKDVLVIGTRAQNGVAFGRGANFESGSTVLGERVVFSKNREAGAIVQGAGTQVTLSELLIEDTAPLGANFGDGLSIFSGASVTVRRALIRRNASTGVRASGPGAAAILSEVIVADSELAAANPPYGDGVQATLGASVELTRAVLLGHVSAGVNLSDPQTGARLTDVVVRDGRSNGSAGGLGVSVAFGAGAILERAIVERNRSAGLLVSGAGSTLRASDLLVRHTLSREPDGRSGHGAFVAGGGALEATRVVFDGNRETGIAIADAGSSAALLDAVIRNTSAPECLMTVCGLIETAAVNAGDSTQVSLDRFALESNRDLGLVAGGEATVSISKGRISGHRIGARADASSIRVEELATGVIYENNGVRLDMSLPAITAP